jgi:hypothetical protein
MLGGAPRAHEVYFDCFGMNSNFPLLRFRRIIPMIPARPVAIKAESETVVRAKLPFENW